MFDSFFPTIEIISTYDIPFEKYYQSGYRGLIFDIDNTLVPHGAPADKFAIELFERLKSIGFSICLLSNNDKERVDLFNKDVNVNSIYKAGKPSKKGYLKACELCGTDLKNTIFIGDQIFTDCLGAKMLGMMSIRVLPINPKEEIQIVLKRYLEKPVLSSFRRKNKKENYILFGEDSEKKSYELAEKEDKLYINFERLILRKYGESSEHLKEKYKENFYSCVEEPILKTLSKLSGNMVIDFGNDYIVSDDKEKLFRKLGVIKK